MSVINDELCLIYEATDESFKKSDDALHGYKAIGFVKTKLRAEKLVINGGQIKSNKSNKPIPLYKCQLIYKIK